MPDVGSPLFVHRMNKAIQDAVLSKMGSGAFVDRYIGEVTALSNTTNSVSVKMLGNSTASTGFKVGPGLWPMVGDNVVVCIAGQERWVDRVLAGSTYPKFKIESDGKHWWGPGGSNYDTNLYRNGVDTLKTDDTLEVNILKAKANGQANVFIGDDALLGDVNIQHQLGIWSQTTPSEGGFVLGADKDTNLYRSAANTLKTDDKFEAAGGLSNIGTTHVDSTFTISGGGSATFDSKSCKWIQIGNWVLIDLYFRSTAAGSGTTDVSIPALAIPAPISTIRIYGDRGAQGVTGCMARIGTSANVVNFYPISDGTTYLDSTAWTGSDLGLNATFHFHGSYYTYDAWS